MTKNLFKIFCLSFVSANVKHHPGPLRGPPLQRRGTACGMSVAIFNKKTHQQVQLKLPLKLKLKIAPKGDFQNLYIKPILTIGIKRISFKESFISLIPF
jgi:hypothetical protein